MDSAAPTIGVAQLPLNLGFPPPSAAEQWDVDRSTSRVVSEMCWSLLREIPERVDLFFLGCSLAPRVRGHMERLGLNPSSGAVDRTVAEIAVSTHRVLRNYGFREEWIRGIAPLIARSARGAIQTTLRAADIGREEVTPV